jgi:hypothetical protein
MVGGVLIVGMVDMFTQSPLTFELQKTIGVNITEGRIKEPALLNQVNVFTIGKNSIS